jgi:hypothetical protein
MDKLKKPINSYELQRKVIKDYEAEQKYKQGQKYIEQQNKLKRYNKSFSGKFGSFLARGIEIGAKKGRFIKTLYGSQMPQTNPYGENKKARKTIIGGASRGRGRPVGTYDSRYARFGGVYGWRKYQAHQMRLQRLEALRRAAVNPRQQQILNQIEARDQAQRMSPEAKPIPNTYGQVPMKGFMDEINFSANLVP